MAVSGSFGGAGAFLGERNVGVDSVAAAILDMAGVRGFFGGGAGGGGGGGLAGCLGGGRGLASWLRGGRVLAGGLRGELGGRLLLAPKLELNSVKYFFRGYGGTIGAGRFLSPLDCSDGGSTTVSCSMAAAE